MIWRKKTTEEIEELQHFVDGMKRGQTLATGDSLLETLRQIHDRREGPIQSHDHKTMLRERLRRQAAAREGRPVEAGFAPKFAVPVVRHRALPWAAAASLAFHVGLGAFLLPKIEFDRLEAPAEQAEEQFHVTFVSLPLVSPVVVTPESDVSARPNPDRLPSAAVLGRGAEGNGRGGAPVLGPSPSVASSPVAQPIAGEARPIVPGFSPAMEDQGTSEIADGSDLPTDPPPSFSVPEKVRPMTEVASFRFDRTITDQFDTAPKPLVLPRPVYPEEALQYQIKGNVTLSVVFGASGRVEDVKVLSGLGHGCDEAAIQAAKQVKFIPAMRNGQAVSVRVTLRVGFQIR